MASLLIVGCGYLGRTLARGAVQDGWTVWGMRRSPSAADAIRKTGAQPIIADIRESPEAKALPNADYTVCALAPARGENYERVYVDGAKALARALRERPPKRLVWVSSTSVYGHSDGNWIDERTPAYPRADSAKRLLEAEQVILASGLSAIVLRLAGIYGPSRTRTELLHRASPSIYADGYVNQIHVEDAAGMLRLLLERGLAGEIYLGVDDEPVLRREFYPWLAERAGIVYPQPPTDLPAPREASSKRCSNAKIKALGYSLIYPGWREGFEAALAQDASNRAPEE